MLNRYFLTGAIFLSLIMFGGTIMPSPFVQNFKDLQSIFWQVLSAAVLGFVLANSVTVKKRGRFRIPHLRF
ncbi:MAG TPA: hypothetical protein VKC89_01870 [Patescibacteria group bacterium]|nr:hypothetical protein [Patescibacteria group bacterium]